MKLNRPPGKLPELTRPSSLTKRRGRGPSLLGICLLAAVIGGPASLAGGTGPNAQVQGARLAVFVAGNTPQTITFDQPQDTKVGEPVTLSASATSGLTVSLTSDTPDVCMVSGFAVTTTTASVCVITASQDGDVTYAAAPEVARSFQVTAGQAPQAISFTPPPEVALGVPAAESVALPASAAPGLAVSFTSSTPDVCTVTGATVQTVAGGTCTITATQGGSATYAAATPATQSFPVTTGQAPQTISFTLPPEVAQPGVPVGQSVALSASAAPGLAVSFTSSTPDVCTVTGPTVQTVAGGTCTITATQGGSATYAAATPATQSFPVTTGQAPQTISFTLPPEVAQPGVPVGEPVNLSASAAPGLEVSFTSDTPQVCAVSEATVLTVGTGPCTITATQPGNADWAEARPVQQTFTVTPPVTQPRPQKITFTRPPDSPVNTAVELHEPKATPSGLDVIFTSSTTDVCTVDGSTATTKAPGPCTITATQPGNADWAEARPVQQTFTVTPPVTQPRPQKITFTRPPDSPVNTAVELHEPKATPSGLDVIFTSSTTDVCTVDGSTATTKAPGPCTITATQPGNADWAEARPVQQTFTVTPPVTQPRPQKITFTRPPDSPVNTAVELHEPKATPSGLDVIFTSSTTDVCTVDGSTATTKAPGPCTITATQPGNADWAEARPVQQTFTVTPPVTQPRPQKITFTRPPDSPVNTAVELHEPKATPSGLDVIFTSSTTDVCTVDGSTATTKAPGPCTITATQPGNADWAEARPVQQTFTVTQSDLVNPPGRKPNPAGHKSQAITFIPPSQAKAGEPVTLSASASSGLPVSFASDTPAVCTVAGLTVTTMTAGECMITASQPGNRDWAPARRVTQSFPVNLAERQVNPAGHKSQAISFDPPSQTKAGDPVTLSAYSSSGLPVSFASDTPPVCTVSGSTVITTAAGACTITASQDGSADYAAAPQQTRSFPVNPASSNWTGPLVFLLAAAVMAAAGLTAAVRHLRLRSRPPLVHAPSVRAVPEPGPPGQVDVHNTGSAPTRTVRIESGPGASITTIEETRP